MAVAISSYQERDPENLKLIEIKSCCHESKFIILVTQSSRIVLISSLISVGNWLIASRTHVTYPIMEKPNSSLLGFYKQARDCLCNYWKGKISPACIAQGSKNCLIADIRKFPHHMHLLYKNEIIKVKDHRFFKGLWGKNSKTCIPTQFSITSWSQKVILKIIFVSVKC